VGVGIGAVYAVTGVLDTPEMQHLRDSPWLFASLGLWAAGAAAIANKITTGRWK
jgi:hypothetical protein